MNEYEVVAGTFDISSIYDFIRRIWEWIYLSMIAIQFKVGNYTFTLMQFIIGLIVASLVISIGFLTIKVRLSDNMQAETRMVNGAQRRNEQRGREYNKWKAKQDYLDWKYNRK